MGLHYKKTITRVYPGIARWCDDNDIRNPKQLFMVLTEKGMTISYHMLLTRLSGQTEFMLSEINQLIEITGQPYRALFEIVELKDGEDKDKRGIYPGIIRWCDDNGIKNINQLFMVLTEKGMTISYHTLLTRLSGRTEFMLSEINQLIEITGQPYGALFEIVEGREFKDEK